MLLNAQISGIIAATQKLTWDFVVHTTLDLDLTSPDRVVRFYKDFGSYFSWKSLF